MKVIVFSDSHGQTKKMINIIEEMQEADVIIHLGDLVKDAEKIQNYFPNKRVEYIAGNNDWFSEEPTEKLIEINGKRIFLTHGNLYGVKYGYNNIIEKCKLIEANLVLFGHTHMPYENYINETLLINPGSIALPARGSKSSFCIIDIQTNCVKSIFKQLGDT